MRCKQGDLAIVIPPATRKDVGKTVTCLELLVSGFINGHFIRSALLPVWRIDKPVVWNAGGSDFLIECCPDVCLMPISNRDLKDTYEYDQPLRLEKL